MVDHGEMVRALCKDGGQIKEEITGPEAHLWHMASAVCGEAGELFDAIKKNVIYRKPLNRKNVIEELGDLEFYMAGIRQGLEITREETLEANIEKLAERYKDFQYSDRAAQERADKDE